MTPGFQASTVPRLGDGAVASQVHGATARAGVDHLGCSNLWRGVEGLGCARVVDRGYVAEDAVSAAANRRLGNPTIREWCDQVNSLYTMFL